MQTQVVVINLSATDFVEAESPEAAAARQSPTRTHETS